MSNVGKIHKHCERNIVRVTPNVRFAEENKTRQDKTRQDKTRQHNERFALGLDLGLTWIFQVKYEMRHQCEQG